MSTLEALVPSRELCEEAAKQKLFGGSALVCVVGYDNETPDKIESCISSRQDSANLCQDMVTITGIYPAPTLEEITKAFPLGELTIISCPNDTRYVRFVSIKGHREHEIVGKKDSAATAALRLLIKLLLRLEGGKQ